MLAAAAGWMCLCLACFFVIFLFLPLLSSKNDALFHSFKMVVSCVVRTNVKPDLWSSVVTEQQIQDLLEIRNREKRFKFLREESSFKSFNYELEFMLKRTYHDLLYSRERYQKGSRIINPCTAEQNDILLVKRDLRAVFKCEYKFATQWSTMKVYSSL